MYHFPVKCKYICISNPTETEKNTQFSLSTVKTNSQYQYFIRLLPKIALSEIYTFYFIKTLAIESSVNP